MITWGHSRITFGGTIIPVLCSGHKIIKLRAFDMVLVLMIGSDWRRLDDDDDDTERTWCEIQVARPFESFCGEAEERHS